MMSVREIYTAAYRIIRELEDLEQDLADMRDDGWSMHHAAYRAAAQRVLLLEKLVGGFCSTDDGYDAVHAAEKSRRDSSVDMENWTSFEVNNTHNRLGSPQINSWNYPRVDRWVDSHNLWLYWVGKSDGYYLVARSRPQNV